MIYESKWCEIDYDTGIGSHFLAIAETLPSLVRLLGLTEATLVRKVQWRHAQYKVYANVTAPLVDRYVEAYLPTLARRIFEINQKDYWNYEPASGYSRMKLAFTIQGDDVIINYDELEKIVSMEYVHVQHNVELHDAEIAKWMIQNVRYLENNTAGGLYIEYTQDTIVPDSTLEVLTTLAQDLEHHYDQMEWFEFEEACRVLPSTLGEHEHIVPSSMLSDTSEGRRGATVRFGELDETYGAVYAEGFEPRLELIVKTFTDAITGEQKTRYYIPFIVDKYDVIQRKVQIKFTGDPLVPRLQKVETKAE